MALDLPLAFLPRRTVIGLSGSSALPKLLQFSKISCLSITRLKALPTSVLIAKIKHFRVQNLC